MVTATISDAERNTIAGKRIGRGRAPQAAAEQLEDEWVVIVILAGGDGTRLQSLTRSVRPRWVEQC